MRFLRLGASTAVIFSFILLSCAKRASKESATPDFFQIGVQTDLLSLDRFSFQSLGETDIKDLLYDPLFYIENKKIKSDIIPHFKILDHKIKLETKDPKLLADIKDNFKKYKESVLWSYTFKDFELEKDSVVYKKKEGFFFALINFVKVFKLEGKRYGAYKAENLVKGLRVDLIKNKNWILKDRVGDYKKNLRVQRIKSTKMGLESLHSKKIKVFVPSEVFNKDILDIYKERIEVSFSKDKKYNLSFYSKMASYDFLLLEVFCSNKKNLQKALTTNWMLVKDKCSSKKDLLKNESRNIRFVFSNPNFQAFLEVYAELLKNKKGLFAKINLLKERNLAEVLQKGGFDYYFSLDVDFSSHIFYYESYHSKGRYNSLKVKNTKLDLLLDQSLKASTLKDFYSFQEKIKGEWQELEPFLFRFTSPKVEFIKEKDASFVESKSLKRLMFI